MPVILPGIMDGSETRRKGVPVHPDGSPPADDRPRAVLNYLKPDEVFNDLAALKFETTWFSMFMRLVKDKMGLSIISINRYTTSRCYSFARR